MTLRKAAEVGLDLHFLYFPVLNSSCQLMDQLISFSAANLIHYNFLSCLLFLVSFLLCAFSRRHVKEL